jgi:hypothetical protein
VFFHCPKCKSVATVPIVYGKPGWEIEEAVRFGLVTTGGCISAEEDRHCRSCGFRWVSEKGGLPLASHQPKIGLLLSDLKARLDDLQQAMEDAFMSAGRRQNPTDASAQLFDILAQYHEAWSWFSHRLEDLGPTICIRDESGALTAQYTTLDARVYIMKNIRWLYQHLRALSEACYLLGGVSGKGSVDDIKKATMMVGDARRALDDLWNRMREDALTYPG